MWVEAKSIVGELYFLFNKAIDTKLWMEIITLAPCYNGHIGMQKGAVAAKRGFLNYVDPYMF